MNDLLDAQELADYLKVSKATIITTLSRAPEKLPERVHGFPFRGPRWRLSAVKEWEDRIAQQPPKRGRPRQAA